MEKISFGREEGKTKKESARLSDDRYRNSRCATRVHAWRSKTRPAIRLPQTCAGGQGPFGLFGQEQSSQGMKIVKKV